MYVLVRMGNVVSVSEHACERAWDMRVIIACEYFNMRILFERRGMIFASAAVAQVSEASS